MARLTDEEYRKQLQKTAWQQTDAFLEALKEGKPVFRFEMPPEAVEETKSRMIENGCSAMTVSPHLSFFRDIVNFLPETGITKLTIQEQHPISKTPLDREFFDTVRRSRVCALYIHNAGNLRDKEAEAAFRALLAEKRMTGLGFDVTAQNILPFVPEMIGNPVEDLVLRNTRPGNPLAGVLAGLPLKSLETEDVSALFLKNRGAVLPMTIESLTANDPAFAYDAAEALGKELARRPRFSKIALHSAAIPGIEPLIETLGRTTVRQAVLPDLECVPELAGPVRAMVEEPGCVLTELTGSRELDPKTQERISDALRLHAKGAEARAALKRLKHGNLDERLADKETTVRTLADSGLLFFAVAENRFGDVVAVVQRTGVALTAKDWLSTDEKGFTLLEHASAANILKDVFQKPCWKTAADMQTVWDAVPAAEKKQMERGNPPFSFRRQKNDLMRSFVLNAVQKTKKGR